MRSIYKPQSLLSLGFFVVVSLFGTPALCHSEPGEESSVHTRDPSLILFAQDDIRLEEITVTSETEHQSKADSSAFATIIKPEKFSKQFKTLPELLSQTPGLNIREHGGLGQLSTLSIRGSSAEQVTVLIDGVRINTPTGGSVDFSAIPLDNVDRIEIIRGGGSAKFGSDAIGGVVNIVTKKPSKKRALNFKLTGGSFYTFKTMESWSEKFDKSSIVLSHSHFSSEGNYKFKSSGTDLAGSATISGQTFKRENSSFFSESLLTKLNHDFNPDLHLNFTNDSFFARRELPGPESETTQLAPTNPLEAKELIATNLTAFTIKKDGALTPSTDFEFGVDNYFSWNDFNDKSPAIGSEIDRNSYNDSVGGHTILSHYLDHKYVDQILTTRSDLKYYYFNDGSDISSTQLIGKKDRFIYSTYLQDEFSILNDKINFTPVVRFEHASDRNGIVNWKFGIIGKPTSFLSLKGNVESSSRYPNFNELYYPDEGFIRGNENLEKEDAINYDVGFVLRSKTSSLEAAYFYNDIDNSIIFVPISATTIQPVNTYKVKSQGVEIQTTVTPWEYAWIEASYTYLKANFASNNNQLPGRPKHKLGTRFNGKYKWLSGYYEIAYQDDLPINTQNTTFISARTRMDCGLTATIKKNYYASADFKNITNVQIYDARGYPLPRFGFFVTVGANI